jgi:hypothetical protein
LWPSRDDARTTPLTARAGSGSSAALPPAIVTCDSLNQLHADTIRATDAAYARALTDRGLRVVDVPVVATEGRAMPPDDRVHTFEHGGHRYTFVPAASYASTHSMPSTAVLVTDGTGNVWKVKRAPRARPRR